MMRHLIFAMLIVAGVMPVAVHAQAFGNSSKQPVEIEADAQLEWIRSANLFRATKNVVITQGDTVIKGDIAEAAYDPALGPQALTVVTMMGNVVITNAGRVITADTATYDTRTEQLQLRGKNLKITAPDGVVTARDSLDYNARKRQAVARGDATITQKNQRLQAEKITAWFGENNELERAVAEKNVLITQQQANGPPDIVRAQHADYNAKTQIATLTGAVTLTRADNHLEGGKGTINLATGESRLESSPQSGGRVRAIFTPGGDNALAPATTMAVPSVPGKKRTQKAAL